MDVAARRIRPVEADTLRERIEALAPWFHNIDLNGVWTAPDHFLGDYPGAKFRRFAPHRRDARARRATGAFGSIHSMGLPVATSSKRPSQKIKKERQLSLFRNSSIEQERPSSS